MNKVVQVEVWQAFLPFSQSVAEALSKLLSETELVRATRSLNKDAANRSLCARGLLRLLLGKRLKINPDKLIIETEPGGKPFLTDFPNCTFSISHSDNCIVIAIADGTPLGVDVEHCRSNTDFDAIVQRFFTSQERLEWRNCPIESRKDLFLRLWTRKEAILKALGVGISGLGGICVSGVENEKHPVLALKNDAKPAQNWWCASWQPKSGFLATLAVAAHKAEFISQTWSCELLEYREFLRPKKLLP